MNKRLFMILFAVIAVLVLFFACSQPQDDEDETDPDTYTVTYDGNNNTSGTVPTDSNTYENGAAVTVLDNSGSLARTPPAGTAEAFKFGGWNTQADGSGTDYTSSSTFDMGSADVVLYAKWVEFELRDEGPAGGLIFYDKESFSDGWRYLEAAPEDQETNLIRWIMGGSTLSTENGNTNLEVGTGRANSEAIIDQEGHEGSAAKICLDFDDGVYSDWFLPSKEEADAMYDNLGSHNVGGFSNEWYWTSSEDYDYNNFVISKRITIESTRSIKKDYYEAVARVRAVRIF